MPSFFDSCVCDVIRRLGSVDSMIRRALVILHIVMVGGVDVRTGADRGSRRSVMICCGRPLFFLPLGATCLVACSSVRFVCMRCALATCEFGSVDLITRLALGVVDYAEFLRFVCARCHMSHVDWDL